MSLRSATIVALAAVGVNTCFRVVSLVRSLGYGNWLWYMPSFVFDLGLILFFWVLLTKQKRSSR